MFCSIIDLSGLVQQITTVHQVESLTGFIDSPNDDDILNVSMIWKPVYENIFYIELGLKYAKARSPIQSSITLQVISLGNSWIAG